MGAGLAALAGILGGLGGLPAGMAQQQKTDQSQQHIDLLQQQLQQQEQANYSDVPKNMLPPGMQGQVDPVKGTLRMRNTLVGPALGAADKETARQEAVKKSSALGLAIQPFADPSSPMYHPSYKALQDALQSGADATQVAPIFETIRQHGLAQQQLQQSREMIAPLFKAMGIEMPTPSAPPSPVTPTAGPPRITQTGGLGAEQPVATVPGPEGIPRTLPTPQQPGVQAAGRELGGAIGNLNAAASGLPGVTPQPPPPATGPAPGLGTGYQKPILTFDPTKGSFSVAAHPEPPAQPGTELVAAMKAKQALQAAGVPPTDPRYGPINDRLDLYKAWVLPPGGAELKGAGSGMDRPGPGPTAQTVPGRPMATTPPPVAAPAETGPAADALSWIKEARARADQLDAMLGKLTPQQRVQLEARLNLQSKPFIGAIPMTSKPEQEISSAIGKLGIDWERASGGLRMAASPQMQDRVRSILGSPTNAATAQHLRTIAGMMEQELAQRAATEAQGGRRPLSAPPGGAIPPSQPGGPIPQTTPPAPQGQAVETVSRSSPAYQNARKSGLTDQQIQQRYGVTITD